MHAPSQTRRSLLEAHARRLVRQRAALADADELGVRAVALQAEDLVADRELGHGRADRLDHAGELHARESAASVGGGR